MLLPILERDAAVQAATLLRHLQMNEPDAFPTTVSAGRWSGVYATGAR